METDIESLNQISNGKTDGRGGAREGAGRPKGTENEETRKRRIAEREYKERVVAHIHDLFNSQLSLAKGLTFLYRINEEKNEDGKVLKRKHVIVSDPEEIRDVLDELDGSSSGTCEDSYYYITTKEPDNRAIDSMMDRVFGKAPHTVKHSGGLNNTVSLKEYKGLSNDELVALAAGTDVLDGSTGEGEGEGEGEGRTSEA